MRFSCSDLGEERDSFRKGSSVNKTTTEKLLTEEYLVRTENYNVNGL